MASRKWNQIPGSMWWSIPSTSTLVRERDRSYSLDAPDSPRYTTDVRDRSFSLKFYEFAEEVQTEENLKEWLKGGDDRGVIRVFQPNSTYSDLIKCNATTTAELVVSKCVATELYIDHAGQSLELVPLTSNPLRLQERFLRSIGFKDPERIKLEGLKDNLSYMFKFIAGKEQNKAEEKVQLACLLKVKELGPFGHWSKRFCVLCGARLYIFSSSQPKGKPSTTLNLPGGEIKEVEHKKYLYCIQVATDRKTVLLSFDTRFDQSVWLKRAAKVIVNHPLEANLTRCSLDKVPKYLFLNRDLGALNLSHNYLTESTGGLLLPQPEGWINDLVKFKQLRILSLSDNNLTKFPVSVCSIATLSELDLSCNRIKMVPEEIRSLKGLSTLLLHSNFLASLPYHLNELQQLRTLVIAFNRFKSVPHIVKELQSLRILILAGNDIRSLPEDIHRIQTLQILDLRLNSIDVDLPATLPNIPNFFSLNIRNNEITEFDMRRAKNLSVVNCSDNKLKSLSLHKGKTKVINAQNNQISRLIMTSPAITITSLDLSHNELATIPDSIGQLVNLEKLMLNHNRLISLPVNLFKSLKQLRLLNVHYNMLVYLPEIRESFPLEILNTYSNKLKKLPDGLMGYCDRLRQLNISNNPITTLPQLKRRQQPLLFDLRAANCSLTADAIEAIMMYKKLKILHLANNSLKIIPPGLFTSFIELEYLNLSGNQIHSLPTLSHACPRLVCLVLHTNNLRTVPRLVSMPSLESLDLSSNDLTVLPMLTGLRSLKILKLCGNPNLVMGEQDFLSIRYFKHVSLDSHHTGALEISSNAFEVKTPNTNENWLYGSAHVRGTNLSKTGEYCMQLLTMPLFRESKQDGLFAIVDGGKAPDGAIMIRKALPSVLENELSVYEGATEKGDPKSLEYLEHTFLTLHRRLGPVGLKYGASMILCRLRKEENNEFVMDVANTGLGEVIVVHGNNVTALTQPHNPTTNRTEVPRVVRQRGFISEDDRVNGVCGVSRLLGCYYLHPQIIPLPDTKSFPLPSNSSCIILATHGLWKFLTYKEVLHMIHSVRDPTLCSRRLAETAIANGCPLDVSVIAVKLNPRRSRGASLDDAVRKSWLASGMSSVSEDSEEDTSSDSEDIATNDATNIDEYLQDQFMDEDVISPTQDKTHLESKGLHAISPEQLDALVMTGVDTEVLQPEGESTESSESDLIKRGSYIDLEEGEEGMLATYEDRCMSSSSDDQFEYIVQEGKRERESPPSEESSPEEGQENLLEKEEDLLKKEDSPQVQVRSKKRLNFASSETQSLKGKHSVDNSPAMQVKSLAKSHPALGQLNRAMSNLKDEDEGINWDMPKGGSVKRKKSFVENAYSRISKSYATDTM